VVDAAVGAIPIAGDLFDFAFKAHIRNLRLLEDWTGQPQAIRRSSILLLLVILIVFIACVAGVIWVVWLLLSGLFHLLSSAG
jgi:Domain of unknown function (DUF4112)